MPFEHSYPGQPLRIRSQDWNGAMDAARAVAGGETGLRAQRLQGQDSNNIVLAKNTTPSDLARFAIVDIDEAVFSADDNANGYKNGLSLKITGGPIEGRFAFIGVVQEPIAAGKFGRVAVSGWTVAYVRGTANMAYPADGDMAAFETREGIGLPIYDRGAADEDGNRLATVLLSGVSTLGMDSQDPQLLGLPAGATGCGCSDCIKGTTEHECEDCDCVNHIRYVVMPTVKQAEDRTWVEVATITVLKNRSGCLWTSHGDGDGIDGPYMQDGGGAIVRDKYRFVVDYSLQKAYLERTVDNGGQLLKLEFCVAGCGMKCLCPWTFEIAADGVEGLLVPEDCRICVTPVLDPTGYGGVPPVCLSMEVDSEYAQVRFSLPEGFYVQGIDPERPVLPKEGEEESTDLVAFTGGTFFVPQDGVTDSWRSRFGPDSLCGVLYAAVLIGCSTTEPLVGVTVEWLVNFKNAPEDGTAGYAILTWHLDIVTEEIGDPIPCDVELELEFVSIEFSGGGCAPTGGEPDPLPEIGPLFVTLCANPNIAATTTGHPGSGCGEPEVPCNTPCLIRVDNEPGIGHIFRVANRSGCESADCTCEGFTYAGCNVVYIEGIGFAAELDEGSQHVVPCVVGGQVELTCGSPESVFASIGESTFELFGGPEFAGVGGATCDAVGVTIDLVFSCVSGCPVLEYSLDGGACVGVAVIDTIVSLDPVDVTFSIPAGVCCAEEIDIHVTE